MSIFGPFPFSTKTEYRVEYTPKKSKRAWEGKPLEGQINFSSSAFPTNLEDRSNKIESFRQKISSMSPAGEKFLSHQLDPNIVNLSDIAVQSTYMVDFSKGRVAREELKHYSLPYGWITPETTQKCSYRSPSIWFDEDIKSSPQPQPRSHFQPNEKQRKILGVATGETDYSAIIGKTGAWIKETKYLGDVSIRPKFDEEDLNKANALKKDNL